MNLIEKDNCRKLFKRAYENRYTWDPAFAGYNGSCSFEEKEISFKGKFVIDSDLKSNVKNIKNDTISKLVSSQLWEVAIHRVRRDFDSVHGENTFLFGNSNEVGQEIIVGGKNSGDRYRIKDDIVTMVKRRIHGKLITIYTKDIQQTGYGYLSQKYTSQYQDVETAQPITGLNDFEDVFSRIEDSPYWVLSQRRIITEKYRDIPASEKTFRFSDMKLN